MPRLVSHDDLPDRPVRRKQSSIESKKPSAGQKERNRNRGSRAVTNYPDTYHGNLKAMYDMIARHIPGSCLRGISQGARCEEERYKDGLCEDHHFATFRRD